MHGDHVFGALVRDVLASGFVGLMIACIMASVMDNASRIYADFLGAFYA